MGKQVGKHWGNILPVKPFKTIKTHFRHILHNPRKPLYLSAFPPPPRRSPLIAHVIPLGLERKRGKAFIYGGFGRLHILYGETFGLFSGFFLFCDTDGEGVIDAYTSIEFAV